MKKKTKSYIYSLSLLSILLFVSYITVNPQASEN